MILRPATAADVPAIEGIVERAYGVYVELIGRRPSPMRDDYNERIRDADVFVAEGSDGLVGLIVLERFADHLLIENVAVDPAFQGVGVGRALLAYAEEFAATHNLFELRLYTNAAMTRNQALYRHLGYREDGRSTEGGFNRVYFSKRAN